MEKYKIKDLKKEGFNHWSACLINKLIVEGIIIVPEEVEAIDKSRVNYFIKNYDDFSDYLEALDFNYACEDFDIIKTILEYGLSSKYIEEGEGSGSYLLSKYDLLESVKDIYYSELEALPSFILDNIDWEAVLDDCLIDYTKYDYIYFYDYI